MAGQKFFRKIGTDSRELQTVQSNVLDAVQQALKSPLLDGILLQNIELASGDNTINHKLGRKIRGFIVVSNSSGATLSDNVIVAANSQSFILAASTSTEVSLWVF